MEKSLNPDIAELVRVLACLAAQRDHEAALRLHEEQRRDGKDGVKAAQAAAPHEDPVG